MARKPRSVASVDVILNGPCRVAGELRQAGDRVTLAPKVAESLCDRLKVPGDRERPMARRVQD